MNTTEYSIRSAAKINIGLHILSKRTDGYHNIETIFYPVRIFDEISLKISASDTPHNNIRFNIEPALSIASENNICLKAVEKFFNKYDIPAVYNIDIDIKKSIPVGGGLGGGSSDAASLLEILTFNFKEKVQTRYVLNRIAMKLGSDVNYFISNKTPADAQKLSALYPCPAYATQRGERLRVIPHFKVNYNILIVYPGISVSTEWAYSKLNIQNEKSPVLYKVKYFKMENFKIFSNDLEEVVLNEYPAIKEIKEKMYEQGAVFSSMSGSGSSVYGFFDKSKIDNARSYFEKQGSIVFKS
ncbi:MAG: 4-(cytidine 5'-diphospho)-2-C-methyl-D-erythritol kinase [Ignavibacteria bacterium]|jgi:4-diphosphocytidyl-2-C-methyl-D-erythritol kinase